MPQNTLKQALSAALPLMNAICARCHEPTRRRYCEECVRTMLGFNEEAVQAREAEARAARERGRLAWANLPPSVPPKTFDTLVDRRDVQGLRQAIAAAKAWASGHGTPWLVLVGSNGAGKSHIAEAALRVVVERGERARLESVVDLLSRLRSCYSSGEDSDALLRRVWGTPWLVLDDLGREKTSEWVQDRLYTLVNERSTRRLRTIVTTNDGLDSLAAKLGRATAERVFDTGSGLATIVPVSGPSWRTERHG